MFQFDFIEGRNTILCLKFSEERVAFCFVSQEYIIQLAAKMVKVFLIIMVFIKVFSVLLLAYIAPDRVMSESLIERSTVQL